MTKFEIRTIAGRSNVYGLWVKLENKPAVMVLQGKKEYLESQEAQTQAEAGAVTYWKREKAEKKTLDKIQAKYPKKGICLNCGYIEVYNKNGNLFKTFKIEY